MKRLARVVLAWPRLVIGCVVSLTAFFAWELRDLRPEVRLRDMTPRNHPFAAVDDELTRLFGAGQTNLLAIGVRRGDVFTPETLRRIDRITTAVEQLPGVVPATVYSITSDNTKALRGSRSEVRVGRLVEELPGDASELAALRALVSTHPSYIGNVITADGRGAIVSADFAEPVDVEATALALEAIAAAERDENTEIFVGGQSPALAGTQQETRGIAPLVALAIVVIGLVHYEAFRTAQAVVLPLVTALLSVIWSLGITSLLGVRLAPWTALTTILVLSVAAGHAVQILKRYYECLAETGDQRRAVELSLERIGPVMVTAGLIAAVGFASLASFGVPAMRDYGLVAACGILSALVIELSFIPAVRVLLPPPRARELERERSSTRVARLLQRLGEAIVSRPALVLAIALVIVGVVASGISRIRVNTAYRSWFSEDAAVIVADRAIRERFTGTSTLRLLVTTSDEEGLTDPRAMRGIQALQETLQREPAVTATFSVSDQLRQMNRAMHEGDPAAYVIPEDRTLIAQYLLLFEPDDLSRVITPDYRAAAIHALSRDDDCAWVEGLLARLQTVAAQVMPAGVTVHLAGGELAQGLANNQGVVREKLQNMAQVGAVVFLLSALVFRSAFAGLLVLAPLLCAVLVNLGMMGWLGSDLSFATATYTSMGVSIGADFAIYLLFRLREQMRSQSLEAALREVFGTSGQAIFFVASAIAAGYATLLVSDFALWRQLGAYVALMMVTSALSTLTLLPALALLFQPRFLEPKSEPA